MIQRMSPNSGHDLGHEKTYDEIRIHCYWSVDIQHWVRSCERYDRDFLKKISVKTGSANFIMPIKKLEMN